MSDAAAIDAFLARLKSEGRSSPAGMHWHEFHRWLSARASKTMSKAPAPLILADSGASDASKHARLREQLHWASNAGAVEEALKWLQALPSDAWNEAPLHRWYEDNWP